MLTATPVSVGDRGDTAGTLPLFVQSKALSAD